MKKLSVFVCFYILTLSLSYAQSGQTKTIQEKRKIILTDEQPKLNETAKPASESPYFGFDHKIIEISLGNTIPVGFPTKENYPTKQQYLNVINKWIIDNPGFIKPEHKGTVITDK